VTSSTTTTTVDDLTTASTPTPTTPTKATVVVVVVVVGVVLRAEELLLFGGAEAKVEAPHIDGQTLGEVRCDQTPGGAVATECVTEYGTFVSGPGSVARRLVAEHTPPETGEESAVLALAGLRGAGRIAAHRVLCARPVRAVAAHRVDEPQQLVVGPGAANPVAPGAQLHEALPKRTGSACAQQTAPCHRLPVAVVALCLAQQSQLLLECPRIAILLLMLLLLLVIVLVLFLLLLFW